MISDIIGVTCRIIRFCGLNTDQRCLHTCLTTTPSLHTSGCKSRWEKLRDRNVAVLCTFQLCNFQDATHHSSLIKKVFRCSGRCWCFDDSVECRGPCFQSQRNLWSGCSEWGTNESMESCNDKHVLTPPSYKGVFVTRLLSAWQLEEKH